MQSHEPLSLAVRLRRDITRRAVDIFRGWSYRDIEIPLLDYVELAGNAQNGLDLTKAFQVVDQDGNLLVLRSDVTPAIARLYARRLRHMAQPLRVCYANRIVRVERAFGRKQTESYQLGVELIGARGLWPELEVILISLEALEAIGVDDPQLNLASFAIYKRLLDKTGLPARGRANISKAVAARDPFEVRDILHRCGTRTNVARALEAVASLRDGTAQLDAIRELIPRDGALTEACDHLERLVAALGQLGYGDRLNVDLGDLQGPVYYTGVIFKIVSERIGRELGGGGRYDTLCASFGADSPAVGFSLQLDALLELLQPEASLSRTPPAGSAVRVDDTDPTGPLRDALERRRRGEMALLVPRSTKAPRPFEPDREQP